VDLDQGLRNLDSRVGMVLLLLEVLVVRVRGSLNRVRLKVVVWVVVTVLLRLVWEDSAPGVLLTHKLVVVVWEVVLVPAVLLKLLVLDLGLVAGWLRLLLIVLVVRGRRFITEKLVVRREDGLDFGRWDLVVFWEEGDEEV